MGIMYLDLIIKKKRLSTVNRVNISNNQMCKNRPVADFASSSSRNIDSIGKNVGLLIH